MMYTFDVETSFDGTKAWVWSWGMCDEQLNTTHGNGVNWIDAVLSLPDRAEVWVHNLPFDGEFAFWSLIERGYKLFYENSDGRPMHGFFTPRIDTAGMMSMDIYVCGKRITLRDSVRLFRCKLEDLPELCGFADEVQKGNIEYNIIRPPDYVPDANEVSYQLADVVILMKALKWLRGFSEKGNTIGAIALNSWKEFTGSSPFTPLTLEQRAEIRSLYCGGVVCCPDYHEPVTTSGRVYDRNSMYPAEACGDLPVAIKTRRNAPPPKLVWSGQWAVHVVAKGLQLKKHGFPLLITPFTGSGRRNIPGLDKWLYWSEWCEIVKQYDIEQYEIVQSMEFETACIAREFVRKWYTIKQMDDERRNFAKFVLNNLTGKFGEWDIHELYKRVIAGGGYLSQRVNEARDKPNKWAFMPAVALITSNSRLALMRAAQASGIENLLYTDTDSVHTTGDLPASMVDKTKLGYWKLENEFNTACYIKPKSYWEVGVKKTVKRHAGLNADATLAREVSPGVYEDTGELISPDNMRSGARFYTRVARKVPGGVVIRREVKKL